MSVISVWTIYETTAVHINVLSDRFWRFRFVVIIKCQMTKMALCIELAALVTCRLIAFNEFSDPMFWHDFVCHIASTVTTILVPPYTETGIERYPIWRRFAVSNKQTTFITHFSQHVLLVRACLRAKPWWKTKCHFYTVKFRRWFAVSQI